MYRALLRTTTRTTAAARGRSFMGGPSKERVDGLSRILADVADSNASLWREKAELKRELHMLEERFAALVIAHEAMAQRVEELSARERQGPLFRRSSGAGQHIR